MSTTQQGTGPQSPSQQQGAATPAPQQGGTKSAPKPVIRDWAAF